MNIHIYIYIYICIWTKKTGLSCVALGELIRMAAWQMQLLVHSHVILRGPACNALVSEVVSQCTALHYPKQKHEP